MSFRHGSGLVWIAWQIWRLPLSAQLQSNVEFHSLRRRMAPNQRAQARNPETKQERREKSLLTKSGCFIAPNSLSVLMYGTTGDNWLFFYCLVETHWDTGHNWSGKGHARSDSSFFRFVGMQRVSCYTPSSTSNLEDSGVVHGVSNNLTATRHIALTS